MMDVLSKPISDSVQMYLVKIKRLEKEMNPVPLSFLAESLSISSVSVNEMCRKMQEQDLIEYFPYKGASLTPEGDREALRILRRHRLWEVFLVEKLQFGYTEAHEMADALEHATSKILADHLDIYLGNPAVNPEGKSIPSPEGKMAEINTCSLAALAVGEAGICVFESQEKSIQDFLKQSGCSNGAEIRVLGKTEKLVFVSANQKNMSLGNQLAEKINVIKKNAQNSQHSDEEKVIKSKSKEKTRMTNKELINIAQFSMDKLEIGQEGTIVSLSGKGPIKQRMMDMGLVPGSQVKIIRVAPLGDPIEIKLKGYNLSLRRNEAKLVLVEVKIED